MNNWLLMIKGDDSIREYVILLYAKNKITMQI